MANTIGGETIPRLPEGVDMQTLCATKGVWPKRVPSRKELLELYKEHYSFGSIKEYMFILDAFRKEFGEEKTWQVADEFQEWLGVKFGKAEFVEFGGRYLNLEVDLFCRPYCYRIDHTETSDERIVFKVLQCPLADRVKEIGLVDLGVHRCPAWHETCARTQGYRFSMPEFLLDGGDCCEQIFDKAYEPDTSDAPELTPRKPRLPEGVDMETLIQMKGIWPTREPSQEEFMEVYMDHYSFRIRTEAMLLLRALKKGFGEDIWPIVEKVYREMGKSQAHTDKSDYGTLLNKIADESTRPYCYTIDHSETTEDKIAYKVLDCPLTNRLKEWGMEKFGLHVTVPWHEGYAEAFGYRFSMPGYVLEGDDCTEHLWEKL